MKGSSIEKEYEETTGKVAAFSCRKKTENRPFFVRDNEDT
jgi:hypothetical protein